jgi:hypothetical protein
MGCTPLMIAVLYRATPFSRSHPYVARSRNFPLCTRQWARVGRLVNEIPGSEDFTKYDDECLQAFLVYRFGVQHHGGRLSNEIHGASLTTAAGRAELARSEEQCQLVTRDEPEAIPKQFSFEVPGVPGGYPMSEKNRRVGAGDVFELQVAEGYVYLQAIGKHPSLGWWAARVSGRTFPRAIEDPDVAMREEERYVVLTCLAVCERDGRIRFVGTAKVPSKYATEFPTFRANAGFLRDGRHQPDLWWLDDGKSVWRVGTLTAEQQKFPVRTMIPTLALRKFIDRSWDPEWEFKGPDAKEFQRPDTPTVSIRVASFFLLFPSLENARKAKKAILATGWSSDLEIQEVDDDDETADRRVLIVARIQRDVRDELEAIDDAFEKIAERYAGEYDGNEIPL